MRLTTRRRFIENRLSTEQRDGTGKRRMGKGTKGERVKVNSKLSYALSFTPYRLHLPFSFTLSLPAYLRLPLGCRSIFSFQLSPEVCGRTRTIHPFIT